LLGAIHDPNWRRSGGGIELCRRIRILGLASF
jgi:hypothetical protein